MSNSSAPFTTNSTTKENNKV